MSGDDQSRGADVGRLDIMKQEPSSIDKRRSEAAKRALAEAEARRQAQASDAAALKPVELGGPKGPEPTRFGDWEQKGIATDF